MLVVVVGWMDGDDDGSYNDGDKVMMMMLLMDGDSYDDVDCDDV